MNELVFSIIQGGPKVTSQRFELINSLAYCSASDHQNRRISSVECQKSY